MPVYLLHGDDKSCDPFLIRERLAELLKDIPREGNLNYSEHDLALSSSSFHEIISNAMTLPFLGTSRTVVVKNLKSFEKKYFSTKSELKRPDDEVAEDDERQDLSEESEGIIRSIMRLSGISPDTLLIFVEENDHLDGRTRLYKSLKAINCIIETFKADWFDPASADISAELLTFVENKASSLGIRISADLAERFLELVGPDKGIILKELEKLALYAGKGSKITESVINSVVRESYEGGIFQLVDLIGYGRTEDALKRLSELIDHGAAAPYILSMIARQIRLIARIREAFASGASRNELASILGEPKFVIYKTLKQVGSFPAFDYPSLLELLMDTDFRIKRGLMDPRLALEILITKIISNYETTDWDIESN